jgi:hypothetical protein
MLFLPVSDVPPSLVASAVRASFPKRLNQFVAAPGRCYLPSIDRINAEDPILADECF